MKTRSLLIVLFLALTLMVFLGCSKEEGNDPPDVSEITVSPSSVTPQDTVTLSVTATDPDDDPLTFVWSEEDGKGTFLATDQASVQWVAPAEVVEVNFSVQVSDGENTVEKTKSVSVGLPAEFSYVGAELCGTCHEDEYSEFVNSGHPYKFQKVHGAPPEYPSFVQNFMELPTGADSWDDIAGVIGGFGWKARFVDQTANIVGTANSVINPGGGQNQHNFFGGTDWGWVDYDKEDVKVYNYSCFRCHTTGPSESGSWLSGVSDIGTFAFGGVQCEACHGPGNKHAYTRDTQYIEHPEGSEITETCGNCHYRDSEHKIVAKGGFVKHHEQYDEFIASKHYTMGLNCATCHDPHKRVIWDGDGIIKECTDCHTTQTVNHAGGSDCENCHMPYAAKSAVKRGDYRADIHSHLFAISTDTTTTMFTEDGGYVLDTQDHPAALDLQHSCLGCHDGQTAPAKTLAELVTKAEQIHAGSPKIVAVP